MSKTYIISGGGTGGHIFPALSIAREIQAREPSAHIHFIGALGRMEMERVPAAGFPITGLHIAGINRQQPWKSWNVPFKLLHSLLTVRALLRRLKPVAVIGTGGYASGPALLMAQRMGIPTLVQEQNSFAGLTNRRLGKAARYVCTAYESAARFFPAERVRLTGNPVRDWLTQPLPAKASGLEQWGFDNDRPLLLVLGGSLGARALNERMHKDFADLLEMGWQILWQCGGLYADDYASLEAQGLRVQPFIDDMASAYAAADLIVSRAGAGTLSELCLVGKPTVLVPSPNVADDHQTHNARALSDEQAAVLLPEQELAQLSQLLRELLQKPERREALGAAMKRMALPGATADIVDLIYSMDSTAQRTH